MEKKNWMIYQSNVQRRIYLDGLLKKTYSAVDRGSFLLNAGAEFPLVPLFKLRLLLLSKSGVHSVLGRCFDHLLGKRGHSQDLHDPSCEYHKCFFFFFLSTPLRPKQEPVKRTRHKGSPEQLSAPRQACSLHSAYLGQTRLS